MHFSSLRLTYALVFSFLFVNSVDAIDLDACKKMTIEIAHHHFESAQEMIQEMNQAIDEIAKEQKLPETIKKLVIKSTKANYLYLTKYNHLIVNIISAIKGVPQNKKDQSYCNKKDRLEAISENTLNSFKKITQKIVNEIPHNFSLFHLEKNEGLAIISVYSDGYTYKLDLVHGSGFNKALIIGPISNHQYFKVVKLKQGDYYWNRINNPPSENGFTFFDLKENNYRFHVSAGKLNFGGMLMIEFKGTRLSSDFYDRSTIAIKMVEQQYPYLVNRYPIVDGFNPDDDFISFYLSEKKKFQQHHAQGK